MIKQLFLPEKIGSYYLFGKRILGIDIGKTHISATQLYLSGSAITLEKIVEHKIPPANATPYEERVVETLKLVLAACDHANAIHTALSSSQVVFKELKLPFMNREQIAKIITFEVEPLLPFATQEAIIDFIITKKIPEEKSSEVLVAATQKHIIAQHLEFFAAAGANPSVITVDFFNLYGLYLQIPSYAQLPGSVALLDLGVQTTQVAYMSNGQLRLIRTLPYGVSTIAKEVSDISGISTADALEELIRFGLESNKQSSHVDAIMQAVGSFWNKINFTLTSFTAQTQQESISHLFLFGGGAHIKGLSSFVTQQMQVPTELLNGTKIPQAGITVPNKTMVTSSSIISLAAAFPSLITSDFNLRRDEFKVSNTRASIQQIITLAALILILLGALLTHIIMQVGKYNTEISQSQEEVLDRLKKHFKNIDPEEETLTKEVIATAQQEKTAEENRWLPFASKKLFLQVLLELTNKIDKEGLGFVPEQITITDTIVTLKARVKDFDALKSLERELRKSKLFSSVESPPEPDFTMKIKLAPQTRGVI